MDGTVVTVGSIMIALVHIKPATRLVIAHTSWYPETHTEEMSRAERNEARRIRNLSRTPAQIASNQRRAAIARDSRSKQRAAFHQRRREERAAR